MAITSDGDDMAASVGGRYPQAATGSVPSRSDFTTVSGPASDRSTVPLRRPRSTPPPSDGAVGPVAPTSIPAAPPPPSGPGGIAFGPAGAPPPSPGRADRVALTANASPPTLVVRTRPFDAILTGIAAAAIGGAVWWAAVAFSHREIPYLALLVGILAGQGVLVGARRGGLLQGVLAAVFCLGALGVAQYFVQRSLLVDASGAGSSVPLWLGFDSARRVVTGSVRDHALTGVLFAVSVVAAAVSAGSASRRPAIL